MLAASVTDNAIQNMEQENIKEILEKCKQIFNEKVFECQTKSGDTLMCSINEAFDEFHENGHNCLGCNLQDDASLIENFLKTAENYDNPSDIFRVYIMLLYLFSEKIFEIKKIIGLPQGYKEKEFEIFRTIKLWANFYKHPKAFILTHHPDYFFDTDKQISQIRKQSGNKIIDLEFLRKYYKGEDSNKYKNLIGELRNNENVKVIIPALDNLTQEFCDACGIFVEIIKENKAYKEILNDLTTLENYFESEYLDKGTND